jgi:hypothetical protein
VTLEFSVESAWWASRAALWKFAQTAVSAARV